MRRILIIDDEDDIREVAALSLESVAGWSVLTACSGAEGIASRADGATGRNPDGRDDAVDGWAYNLSGDAKVARDREYSGCTAYGEGAGSGPAAVCGVRRCRRFIQTLRSADTGRADGGHSGMELATTMESGCHPPPSRRHSVNGHGHEEWARARRTGMALTGMVPTGMVPTGMAPTGIVRTNGSRPGDVARELISALWERSVPLITDRLNGLDIACEAAVVGRLSPIMRRGATDTAHKLAGSLGMFGYPRGTELAREIEQLLEY